MKKLFLTLLLLNSFACAKFNLEHSYPNNSDDYRKSRAGKFFSDDLILYGEKEVLASERKNTQNLSKLFLSAKDVILSFNILEVADPELGIISSYWKIDLKNNRKTRIMVFIEGEEILPKNISVVIYQKSLDKDGHWKDDKPKNQDKFIEEIKSKIIKNAK